MVTGDIGLGNDATALEVDGKRTGPHQRIAVERPPARPAQAWKPRADDQINPAAPGEKRSGVGQFLGADEQQRDAGPGLDEAAEGGAARPRPVGERADCRCSRGLGPGAGKEAPARAAADMERAVGRHQADLAGVVADEQVRLGGGKLDQRRGDEERQPEPAQWPREEEGERAGNPQAEGEEADPGHRDAASGQARHFGCNAGEEADGGADEGRRQRVHPEEAEQEVECKERHDEEAGQGDGEQVGGDSIDSGPAEMRRGDGAQHQFGDERGDEQGACPSGEAKRPPVGRGRKDAPPWRRLGDQNERGDGSEAQLEAGRDERLGPGEEDEGCRQRDQPEREGVAPERQREEDEAHRHSGPDGGDLGAGERDIDPCSGDGDGHGPRAERAAAGGGRQGEKAAGEQEGSAGHHADVKARDGQEMGKSRDLHGVAQRLRDSALAAGHQRRGHGAALGAEAPGEEPVDPAAGSGEEMGGIRGGCGDEPWRAGRPAARAQPLEPGAPCRVEAAGQRGAAPRLEGGLDGNGRARRDEGGGGGRKRDGEPNSVGAAQPDLHRCAATLWRDLLDHAGDLAGGQAMVEDGRGHAEASQLGHDQPGCEEEAGTGEQRPERTPGGKARERQRKAEREGRLPLLDPGQEEPGSDPAPEGDRNEERPLRPLGREQSEEPVPRGRLGAWRIGNILRQAITKGCHARSFAIGRPVRTSSDGSAMVASEGVAREAPLYADLRAPVVRFAPSPTGYLHIGGARTALFNYLFARHHGGTFLLRIEDTDRARSTRAAIDAILDSLDWLGLAPDRPVVFQSERAGRHAEVARALLAAGRAYRCYATPEELEAMRAAARAEGRPPHYDRRWRDRTDWPSDRPYAVRLKAPLEGAITVDDRVQGPVTVAAAELDDFILLRSDGTPTYMLAVVVDDHDMGVTHVIRGDDHLSNTHRQLALIRALGWPEPVYAHVPMIHGPDGAKLSKRHGAVGVETWRDEKGILPEAMENYLLRLGWAHGDAELLTRDEAIPLFDLEGIGRSPARFDMAKLESINAHYLKRADDSRLVQLLAPRIAAARGQDLSPRERDLLLRSMPELKVRAKDLNGLAASAGYLFAPRPVAMDAAAAGLLDQLARQLLGQVAESLAALPTWERGALEAAVKAVAEAAGVGLGKVAAPLRAALTGTTVSPSVFGILEVLGRDESLARIRDAYREEG